MAEALLHRASVAADRIEHGVQCLADPLVLDAFRIANRAMAAAARQRQQLSAPTTNHQPLTTSPHWRPFQLAFLLMNSPGLSSPRTTTVRLSTCCSSPRAVARRKRIGPGRVTPVRRLRHPSITSAGLMLMRYTLRLLTLDQLSRAATLICALELERQQDVEKLGPWPSSRLAVGRQGRHAKRDGGQRRWQQ